MKFIADAMLGRLAKWLRLLGFDVLYFPDIEDKEVVKICFQQNRTILTRDTRMLRRRGARDAVFIKSDHVFQQLQEMKNVLDLCNPDPGERCVACNGNLQPVTDRSAVQDLVPDYVYHNFESFRQCDGCGKVYWEGSHYKDIRERLRDVLRKGNEG